jgi:hypothetical protein
LRLAFEKHFFATKVKHPSIPGALLTRVWLHEGASIWPFTPYNAVEEIVGDETIILVGTNSSSSVGAAFEVRIHVFVRECIKDSGTLRTR